MGRIVVIVGSAAMASVSGALLKFEAADAYEKAQHWPCRLWFYGTCAFERVPVRQPVFRCQISARAQGSCRAGSGKGKTLCPQMGVRGALRRLETSGGGSGDRCRRYC